MEHILLTDAAGFAAAAENDISHVVLYITRREIEAARVGDIVDRLMNLSDCPDHTRRFKHALAIVVDGYDDDTRELTDIPEVVSLFRDVDAQWPYWLHFLSPEAGSLQLVIKLLLDLGTNTQHGDQVFHTFDQSQLTELLKTRINAMNLLHEQHGLSMDESAAISRKTLQTLDTSFI